jgi:hypothetical protein
MCSDGADVVAASSSIRALKVGSWEERLVLVLLITLAVVA